MSDYYRADFLWEHEDGSIKEAGYEFANGKTEEYVRQWWEELLLRVRESDQQTVSQQRQTIDALTAALEKSVVSCELSKNRLYEIKRHTRVDSQEQIDTIDRAIYSAKEALEKARRESK